LELVRENPVSSRARKDRKNFPFRPIEPGEHPPNGALLFLDVLKIVLYVHKLVLDRVKLHTAQSMV
jgi:hypothetical protein